MCQHRFATDFYLLLIPQVEASHIDCLASQICVLEGELRSRFLMCVPFCFCLATDLRKILNPPKHVAELLQNYDAIGNKVVFGCKMSRYDQPWLKHRIIEW